MGGGRNAPTPQGPDVDKQKVWDLIGVSIVLNYRHYLRDHYQYSTHRQDRRSPVVHVTIFKIIVKDMPLQSIRRQTMYTS